jgi:hypothetical protein
MQPDSRHHLLQVEEGIRLTRKREHGKLERHTLTGDV